MIYFDPKPNYERLSKYLELELYPKEMYLKYPEGALIAIDWWQSKEQVEEIESRFKNITQCYGLSWRFRSN